MPRIDGTTNAQSTFLRAFRSHPAGPPPDQWPAPAILRRWLRSPAFCHALHTLRQTLQFRSEFQLACAATQATSALATNDPQRPAQEAYRLLHLLRIAHQRDRFPRRTTGVYSAAAALPQDIRTAFTYAPDGRPRLGEMPIPQAFFDDPHRHWTEADLVRERLKEQHNEMTAKHTQHHQPRS
jgi:hypothetical protein